MKALREVRPPGIYPVGYESHAPLTMADAHIAGFVGLASKGPLNTPYRVRSWAEFVEVFGATSEGYLARSVEGFFQNGGQVAYIVRVARRPLPGQPLTPEHAVPAERLIKDGYGKYALRILANSEGRWGNNIWVRVAHTTGASTLLTLDLEVGAGAARVNSLRGFEPGALVRIYDRQNSDYVILTDVKDNQLFWGTETPIVRGYAASSPTFVEVLEFEIHATLKDRKEVFRNLQMSPRSRRYAPRIVNEQSTLIRLEDLHSSAPPPYHMPAPSPPEKLSGGRDGTEGMTAEDYIGYDHGMDERTGLMTLEHIDEVGLLVVPDAMLAYSRMSAAEARVFVDRIYDAMIDICERTQDRFAILDMPDVRNIEEIRKIRFGDVDAQRVRPTRTSSYAAYYFPWLEVPDSSGKPVKIPPSGIVAGVYARCDVRDGVHKAPANEPLVGVTQLTLALTDDHIGQLNSDGVNTLRAFTGRGIRIWGARTLSNDPDWRYLNVRRLFIMLRKSLMNGTQWVCFEPNTPATWAVVRREIAFFLGNLWNKGYFAGKEEQEAYLVQCDEETNPPEVIDSGRLIVQIRVAPALPAEYILLTLEQRMNQEAPAAV
ncbi:MAG: phage tail sheath subtilisin-like domain-containing protein [Myxococcales bacterium]|nr:phage tail sheath subtilisin-like domain-containing protein [Myxococcota bacterium]MDW8281058.1 phage tail sheath subtilisin-like domain-containing protein [Myxococcales bacterium]